VPTYQYACTDCAERSEVVQKFTDEPLLVCSLCGGRLRKVFSPVGIVFKGSGFYRTDSRAGATKDKVLNGSAGNGSDSASGPDSGGGKDAGKDGGSSSGDKKADKSAAATSSSGSGSGSGGSGSPGSSSSGSSPSSSSGSKVA
jgi:putative FmdB family regulatory protein